MLDYAYLLKLPKEDAVILTAHADRVCASEGLPKIGKGYFATWLRRAIVNQAAADGILNKLEVLGNEKTQPTAG